MKPVAFALLLAGGLYSAAAPAALQVFTRGALTERLNAAAEQFPRLPAAPAAKQTADMLREIEQLLATPGGDPALEYRLRQLVLALPTDAALSEQRAVLDAVAARPASVFVWREEDAHRRQPVVAIDPAAAAAWKLTRMAAADARRRFTAQLQTGLLRAEDLRAMSAPMMQGARTAFAAAPIRELETARNALLQLAADAAGDARATEVVRVAATRLHDPQLALTLLRQGNAQAAADALPTLMAAMPAEAFAFLDAALARSALAERAVAAHAPLLQDEPAARTRLLDLLDDSALGASAAATLARAQDPALQAALLEIMHTGAPLKARRAALALYLDGSAGARARLSEYLASPADGDLAVEVEQWLAR